MIVELRTYKIKHGMRAKFIDLMNAKLIPEHKKIGMKVAGPFASVDNKDVLFWMRGSPDAASLTAMTGKFYGGELWQRELSDAIMPILEKYDVVTVEMPESAVLWQ